MVSLHLLFNIILGITEHEENSESISVHLRSTSYCYSVLCRVHDLFADIKSVKLVLHMGWITLSRLDHLNSFAILFYLPLIFSSPYWNIQRKGF